MAASLLMWYSCGGGFVDEERVQRSLERDKDGYLVASVPALRGCHTQAKSLDVLMERVKEAIELCLEVEEPLANEFVGVQHVVVKV